MYLSISVWAVWNMYCLFKYGDPAPRAGIGFLPWSSVQSPPGFLKSVKTASAKALPFMVRLQDFQEQYF